jgi:hypothetical protein
MTARPPEIGSRIATGGGRKDKPSPDPATTSTMIRAAHPATKVTTATQTPTTTEPTRAAGLDMRRIYRGQVDRCRVGEKVVLLVG